MDEERINALKEAAFKYRNNHPLKQFIIDNTELVRTTEKVDNSLLDTGKKFVVSCFIIKFCNHANKVVNQLQRADNNIERRYNNWLEQKAIPYLNQLPGRLNITNWNDLINLIMITDNRIKTLEKTSEMELPSVLIEVFKVLKNKLRDNGLLKDDLLVMEDFSNVERFIINYHINYYPNYFGRHLYDGMKEKNFADYDLDCDNVGYKYNEWRQKWHEWRKNLQ